MPRRYFLPLLNIRMAGEITTRVLSVNLDTGPARAGGGPLTRTTLSANGCEPSLTKARTDHGPSGAALTEPVDLGFDCHTAIHEAAQAVLSHAERAGSVRADAYAGDVIQFTDRVWLTSRDGGCITGPWRHRCAAVRSTRLRSSGTPALRNICLLIILMWSTRPSPGPEFPRTVRPAVTAFRSDSSPWRKRSGQAGHRPGQRRSRRHRPLVAAAPPRRLNARLTSNVFAVGCDS